MTGYGDIQRKEAPVPDPENPPAPEPVAPSPNNWKVPNWPFNMEHVKDVIAVFSGALMLLATQLDTNGFHGVQWAGVAAAALGGLIAWSRNGSGGFRAEKE